MHFTLTQEHVTNSAKKSPADCPIARCIGQQFPRCIVLVPSPTRFSDILILSDIPKGYTKIDGKFIRDEKIRSSMSEEELKSEIKNLTKHRVEMSQMLKEKVSHYDKTEEMEPFEFDLDIKTS